MVKAKTNMVFKDSRIRSVYMHGVASPLSVNLAERFGKTGATLYLTDTDQAVLTSFEKGLHDAGKLQSRMIDDRDPYQIEYAINKAYTFLG